jgi:two-component system, LytTR family, response regulator
MKDIVFGQIKYLSNPEQITHLVAQKNYSLVYFSNGTTRLVAYNLKKLEDYLADNTLFKRVHKSYIVNTSFISNISEDGERLRLMDKTVIPITHKLELSA